MKKKTVLLAYLIIFCCIPLITPNISIQATTNDTTSFNFQNNNNATSFYVYQGKTNKLTAYVNEQNQAPRFQTTVGGAFRYNWQDVVGGANNYEISSPGPGIPEVPESQPIQPEWLYNHGLNLSVKIAVGFNPLEFCYNSSYRDQIIAESLQTLSSIPYINLVSTIHLGDEAPATLYNWQSLPSAFNNPIYSIYNASMHAETGIWMRTSYDANSTQNWIAHNWISNKTMWSMNAVYDGVKQVYPNKLVGWDTMDSSTGFEPTLLKSDFLAGGYYTNDFRNFYSQIRFAKLLGPNKSIDSVIMGSTDPVLAIPQTQQQQFFWTAYFAGGTGVTFFDEGNNMIYNSVGNTKELANYQFHNNLNKLADTLPVLNPKPLILSINTLRGGFVGTVPGFREFDATTQFQAQLPNFSLNQYKIIVLQNQYQLTDQLTNKLTNYVNTGGNLILKGDLQAIGTTVNASGQPRTSFLPLEIGSSIKEKTFNDPEILNFQSSLINSALPGIVVGTRASLNFTISSDWTPIPTGLPEEALGYYPLALYHNSSNPNSGYILYYGFSPASDSNTYVPIIRAYVQNYLHLNDIMTPADNPNILISTSLDNDNRTIVGIIPDSIGSNEFINVNVTERNLPQDNVWDYNGTSDELWMGSAYDPTNPSGTATFPTILTPYSAQRWILAPEYPSADADLRVFIQYPSADPYIGEQVPITVHVNEGLQYVALNGFSIKLTVPQDLSFSSSSKPSVQTMSQLPYMTDNSFQWLVKADKSGLYHLGLTITSLNLTRTFEYTFSIQVNTGRLEISLRNILYFTPNDKIYIPGTITYQGNESQQYEIYNLIEDMIWGNPGGWAENVTFNPGETYHFNYFLNAINYTAGDSGALEVFAYNKAFTTISESFVLIKILPALLRCSPLKLNNGVITSTISIDGNDYINNVKAELYIGNSKVPNSDRFLGAVGPNSTVELTWDSSSISKPSTLTLLVSGNSVPSISESYSLKQQTGLFSTLFTGTVFVIVAFLLSLFTVFVFDAVKSGKIFHRRDN